MTQVYTRASIPPLHERRTVYEPHQDRYTPRNIPDHQKYSVHSPEKQHEENAWSISASHSPMNDQKKGLYEVARSKAGDMYTSCSDTGQKPPREQLPPLSSLFGSSVPQPRPAPSIFPESKSPVFSAGSPYDSRHPATPLHPDRPYEGPYFQRPPVAWHFSYNARPEQVESLGIPPPPTVTQVGRPESPRCDPRYGLASGPKSQAPPSVNSWAQQPSRADYFPRDTSSSFRAHADHRQQPPAHRVETDRQPYRDTNTSVPVTPTYPTTPASTVSGDPNNTLTKDGLGPKIWTGTQFLPRFVRQAEVPGEGMCYFYDDGTHCKTVIEGEMVNAHWGVTKAGKPRKRLAIACITCREKKIKCDPDYPRCVQCEKFGRICKFKNAPRGHQGSPDTPPADLEDGSRPVSSRADLDFTKGEKGESSRSVSPRQVLCQATPDSETHHAKRQRNGYNDFTPVTSEASPRASLQEIISPATPWAEPLGTTLIDHSNLLREWHTNPFTMQPALAAELVAVFFKHVPETVYSIFPERAFRGWILSNTEKSLDDLMLVHTILALGTVFSLKSEHKGFGAQCAAISRYACDNRPFSIQLVQSRLILSFYYFATNAAEDAWDFCGAAMRAASGLKLNVEIEKSEDAFRMTYPYGLTRAGYAECRRRTFWTCYLTDRFNGFCSVHLSNLHPEDVFLRLPCDANSFESQVEVQNPFFDVMTPPIQNSNWTVGTMAYLINIATIWGDVMASIYRTSQSPKPISSYAWQTFYESASRRLRAWDDSLPSGYTFSPENLTRAANNGQLGTFMMMHTLYHTTAMKLNRYIQMSTLNSARVVHHVNIARQHAEALLSTMDALANHRNYRPPSPTSQRDMHRRFLSPFSGYAIVSAIDILTAKLSPACIPDRLRSFGGSQSILAELAHFWPSSKNQHALIQQRIQEWADIAKSREEAGGAGAIGFKFGQVSILIKESSHGVLEMREAIEKTFPRDYDCVYA